MKKKTAKKLVLSKETLRNLGDTDLAVPQGGTLVPSAIGTICVCGSGHMHCFNTQQSSCPC